MGNVNGDYYSKPIYVNTGIPIGGEGEQATELYVSPQLQSSRTSVRQKKLGVH